MIVSRLGLTLLVLLLASANLSFAAVAGDELTERLEEAINTYREAMDAEDPSRRADQFSRAEMLFQSVAETQGGASSNLQMCIGNSALGAERLGQAILAYRRVLSLDPDHKAANQNLEHARSLLPAGVPRPEANLSFGSVFDRLRQLGRGGWLQLATGCFLLACLLLAFALRWEKVGLRNAACVAALAWVGCLVAAFGLESGVNQRDGVVTATDVLARSADSVHAPVRLAEPLPGGTEVVITEDRGDWLKIRLADAREAWLPASAVELVSRQ